ncbi:UDP-N-acetylglucosamine 1-carboxyvinyltransferase [Bacteroidia bacterium]|nr:UDP-N-acetylglucosamine 1-carboxyvinyltransferase [Bacteroidia bacterium]
MGTFKIEGGHQLKGTLTPQGAKNEALQILAAVLLSPKKIILKNIPEIRDILKMIELLKGLGVTVAKLTKGEYSFQADQINLDYFHTEEFRTKGAAIRGSIMIIGPLLARFGIGFIPSPGGDKIGRRRLDTHFIGFENLGAEFTYHKDSGFYKVEAKKLKGSYMLLEEASVTGTANILMAASMADGTTTIYNAACEPYLQQLCKMINSMGGKISGIGSNLLTVEGVSELEGCEHTILPDMIEIGSFISLAALTQSEITIENCRVDQLGIIPNVFKKLGVQFDIIDDNIVIPENKHYEIDSFIDGSMMTISDATWPGLSPDLLSVILVMCTQAKGNVLIHQKMFESRLFFVDNLIDMGAQIILCDPHRATVMGLDRRIPLKASTMASPDIRAGVSLLIAAMSAQGTSTIHNIEQIDRGYQDIEHRLNAIGAKITRL